MPRALKWLVVLVLLPAALLLAFAWQPDRPAAALEARWATAPSKFIDS